MKTAIRGFLATEVAGGILLMAVALLALVLANSPLSTLYFSILATKLFGLTVLHWINDALMAVFFLLVGLEIKRELLDGQLSTWPRRMLPGMAALGGMAVPAAIFVAFNLGTPETLRGWAIPSATDIAFALAALALLGPRVPVSLKIFLTALAILDDLGAVAIIAVFYTAALDMAMLAASAGILAVLALLNRRGINALAPYLVLGGVLWFFVLQSGVHATIAGVLLACTIPLRLTPGKPEASDCALIRLEHALQPLSAFLIIPVFGFANAGVSFDGLGPGVMLEPVPIGVAVGLFVGKQLGVFAFAAATIRLGLADLPAHATWLQLYGTAILCGIGFTMSLFIGLLAFPDRPATQDAVKVGVLVGSLLSAVFGMLLLTLAGRRRSA